jgi:hypothetical protein
MYNDPHITIEYACVGKCEQLHSYMYKTTLNCCFFFKQKICLFWQTITRTLRRICIDICSMTLPHKSNFVLTYWSLKQSPFSKTNTHTAQLHLHSNMITHLYLIQWHKIYQHYDHASLHCSHNYTKSIRTLYLHHQIATG